MSQANNLSEAETQIRALIAGWTEAFRGKDVEKLMSYYDPELRVFDLQPPLEFLGTAATRRNWETWFPSFEGGLDYEVRDLKIHAASDLAYSHSLNKFGGKKYGEEAFEIWVRVTVAYVKKAGQWKICHEHISVPFYMDGSFRASTDLKP